MGGEEESGDLGRGVGDRGREGYILLVNNWSEARNLEQKDKIRKKN